MTKAIRTLLPAGQCMVKSDGWNNRDRLSHLRASAFERGIRAVSQVFLGLQSIAPKVNRSERSKPFKKVVRGTTTLAMDLQVVTVKKARHRVYKSDPP